MTEHSEVDLSVLAGEPGSAQQLEGGDDDLPLTPEQQQWAAADRVVDANPTALGE